MAKRNKQQAQATLKRADAREEAGVPPAGTIRVAVDPPAKNPTLLAVSFVLFALWFSFLLVTALFG